LKGYSTYSDQELSAGIVRKDEDIVRAIYFEHYHSIKHMIMNNNGSEDDAKDIFQDALIVLYQKFSENNFKLTSSLGTFLYSIARILWYRELRRRRKLLTTDEFIEHYDNQEIQESIERKERLEFFREKYEELSEDCKQVLQLFLNNIPIKEITKLMGYSSDQHTKNRRLRCKMSLMNKIRSSEYYNELSNGKNKDHRIIP
jgi:RNA polymerase sigma factor (sigma-70 family)